MGRISGHRDWTCRGGGAVAGAVLAATPGPMSPTPARVRANLSAVRSAIAEACARVGRNPAAVRLIAVTKEQTPEVLPILVAAGISEIGENRLDHLEVMRNAAPAGLDIHFIGRVQGRQLAKLLPQCVALHSLCDSDHIERLGRACAAAGRSLAVFLQVNTAGDSDKAGMTSQELPARLELARRNGLDVVGLMTMAPLGGEGTTAGGQADPDTIRRCFAALRELAVHHALPRLSMGMSHDFPLAVEEGATDIRVGSRLFA